MGLLKRWGGGGGGGGGAGGGDTFSNKFFQVYHFYIQK